MHFHRFYCAPLAQACYLLGDGDEAIVVDPPRDPGEIVRFAVQQGLRIRQVIATHVHADFVAGLLELAEATGAAVGLGDRFRGALACELLADEQVLRCGDATLRVIATPGHTEESISLLITPPDDNGPVRLLSGDTLFIGDVGRPDLACDAGASVRDRARQLHDSVQRRIAVLPDATEVWPAHGAGSACGSSIGTAISSTLGAERLGNWAFGATDPEAFCDRLLRSLRPPPRYFPLVFAMNRDGPRRLADIAPPREMTVDECRRALDRDACLLDVRGSAIWARGHWPGAHNIGIGSDDFEGWAGVLLPPERDLVVHASSADDAAQAFRRLLRIGCERVTGYVLQAPAAAAVQPQIEAIDLFQPEADWQVIDVRRPAEFHNGHITGAAHCELGATMPAAALAALDRGSPTAVICETGYRSRAALVQLRDLGFTALHDVRDGMRAWRGNHLPMDRDAEATASS